MIVVNAKEHCREKPFLRGISYREFAIHRIG
jgi:hypothetical protein